MLRLWIDLPPEIFEKVLACLPVRVLCRFRLVCKKWNHLITHPAFASLSAHVPRRAPCILTVPRIDRNFPGGLESRRDWEILDIVENRFCNVWDIFVAGYLHRILQATADLLFGWNRCTLAADGGLIYAMYQTGAVRCHMVCNFVSKDFHHIMAPELNWSYNRDIVVMSVDNTTQSYKIITMEPYGSAGNTRRERLYMYDSTTEQWRKICEVPDDDHRAYSCIFLNGVFYTLFVNTSAVPWCLMLYSCDFETGAWSHIDVELPQPSCPQDKSQLVVSLGRLFFVEYTGLPTGLPMLVPSDHMTT